MRPKRKLKTVLSKDEQPKAKKLKVEEKERKEAKEEPLEDNEDERIEDEKPVKKPHKKYVYIPRPIDGDPKSKFLCKRLPSLFLELKDANPQIKLEDLEKITCGSHQILNWECLNHKSCKIHVWKAKVYSRVNGKGCPYCSTGKRKKECLCTQPNFKNPDGSYKPGQEQMKRCTKCMIEKHKDDFSVDKRNKNGFNSWCKKCFDEYRAVQSAMMRRFLKGKCCQDCGTTNDVVLEFDHINDDKAKDKNGKPKKMKSICPQKMCLEFKKTEIVCVWCHRLRTYSRCSGTEPISKKELKKRELVQKLKLERQCCLHCPNQITKETTYLFDCDHVDPETKIEAVSQMITQKKYTVKDVENEIAKCQLLCCNCHRVKTAKDLEWRKLSDFSEEIIAKAEVFLDQQFQKDVLGNYIHVNPVKIQSNGNLMALLAALSDQESASKKVQSFENLFTFLPGLI